MPAYISHAIMGEQLYNECKKENLFNYIPIDAEEIKGYSLGVDFSYLSKDTKEDPHNSNTKEFFKSLKNVWLPKRRNWYYNNFMFRYTEWL